MRIGVCLGRRAKGMVCGRTGGYFPSCRMSGPGELWWLGTTTPSQLPGSPGGIRRAPRADISSRLRSPSRQVVGAPLPLELAAALPPLMHICCVVFKFWIDDGYAFIIRLALPIYC